RERHFHHRLTTAVTHVHHGLLTRYLGGYDDYLAALGPGDAVPGGEHAPFIRETGATTPAPPTVVTGHPAPRPMPPPPRMPSPPRTARTARAQAGDGAAKVVARSVRTKTTTEMRELRRRVDEIERKSEGLE